MKHLLALGSLALALVVTSCGKDENDDTVSLQDRTFVNEITLSNRSEIALANLALTKSTDASVRRYAQLMITDHTMAETQLGQIASKMNAPRPADSLNAMAAALRPVLAGLTGRRFDSAYSVSQIAAHRMALDLVANMKNSLNRGTYDLRNFAQSLEPKIQMHYVMADTMSNRFR